MLGFGSGDLLSSEDVLLHEGDLATIIQGPLSLQPERQPPSLSAHRALPVPAAAPAHLALAALLPANAEAEDPDARFS